MSLHAACLPEHGHGDLFVAPFRRQRSPLSQEMTLASASIVQRSGSERAGWVHAHAPMHEHVGSLAQAGGMGMHHAML